MSTTRQKTLSIDGMHCEHCVDAVRSALSDLQGVTVQDVAIGTAEVTYDPSVVTDDQVVDALEESGYELAS